MSEQKSRTIKVEYLARVEGEAAMHLDINGNVLDDVKLKIFEPPRFFEGFLRGREYSEAPDITARICGICPVAYQMSAVHAMEDAFGIIVDGQLRELRRLLYCGEWISSHTLHIAMLHAPDFLGYASAIEMAKTHPEAVENALTLKKAGNAIMQLLGGREIHPINVRVGGFYRLPTRTEMVELKKTLEEACALAKEMLEWVSCLDFPGFSQDYVFVSLRHDKEYPFNEGRIVSNTGLDIPASKFDAYFEEEHVNWSNALHCTLKDQGAYLVGPMARYALNFDHLPEDIQEAALQAGLGKTCTNPFQSIIVRAVEVLYACSEAIRIIDAYQPPETTAVSFDIRAGTGHGCTEAPRGLLYHHYTIDKDGLITDANIVPPTSQNQKRIEDDLRNCLPDYLEQPDDKLQWIAEHTIRNYDPCISCATHFLKLEVNRKHN